MLMASVSRSRVLTRWERSSSQETRVKRSMGRDWRVASESQRDQSMASHVAESSPRRSTTVCGVKSARGKKYGDGSKSGSSQAENALRNASGEPRYTLERLMPEVASSRASLGKKRDMVVRRVTCAVARKEL